MSFLIVSAAIGAGSALYGVGKSIAQSSQANSIDKNNPRPNYNIPEEYTQNVNMAKHMAQIGMPQQQYNNQLNNINQNQAGAIGALSNSANPGANLASIVRGGDAATGQLNAADAQARQQNQRFAIGQNAELGQQKLAQQQYNKFDKYSEDYNKSQAIRGAAAQNMQNGINGLASTATNLYAIGKSGSGSPADTKVDDGTPQWGQSPTPIGANGVFTAGSYNPTEGWGLAAPKQNPYSFDQFNPYQRR